MATVALRRYAGMRIERHLRARAALGVDDLVEHLLSGAIIDAAGLKVHSRRGVPSLPRRAGLWHSRHRRRRHSATPLARIKNRKLKKSKAAQPPSKAGGQMFAFLGSAANSPRRRASRICYRVQSLVSSGESVRCPPRRLGALPRRLHLVDRSVPDDRSSELLACRPRRRVGSGSSPRPQRGLAARDAMPSGRDILAPPAEPIPVRRQAPLPADHGLESRCRPGSACR